MKLEVKQEFHDINDYSLVYHEGDVVEFDEERAQRLLDAKIAVKYIEPQRTRAKKA